MPTRTPKLCGCGQVVTGKCKACTKDYRPHAAKRGYDTQWRAFRVSYIRERIAEGTYHCDDCGKLFLKRFGGTSPELHHKQKLCDHPDLKFDPDNILMLHKTCHAIRTARGE